MLRVVFFDLGGTLVDADRRPFPYAADALATIGRFRTAGGKPLLAALVSDFDMPEPPPSAAKIRQIFSRYLDILDETGLRPLFEPVERRVTLSAHAGAFKPAAAVFRTALKRLRSTAPLERCLLVTENDRHVRAVRTALHMQALRFGGGRSTGDFDDWRQAPAFVARLIEETPGPNTTLALERYLHVAHAFDAEQIHAEDAGRRFGCQGTLWTEVRAPHETGGDSVYVPFPSEATVARRRTGAFEVVGLAAPDSEALAEAASFAKSLSRHGQIRGTRGSPVSATTHEIEVDDQGRRKLVRRRFSVF